MALPFPKDPVIGQLFTSPAGVTYQFTSKGGWRAIQQGDSDVRFSAGPTPPENPIVGEYWLNTSHNKLGLYSYDGTNYYWNTVGVHVTKSAIAPSDANEGDFWYNNVDASLYSLVIINNERIWKVISSSASNNASFVLGKILPLTWRYDDERFDFESFIDDPAFTWRDAEVRKVVATDFGDDTIDLESTEGLKLGNEYVIFNEDRSVVETIKIFNIVSSTRIRATTSFPHTFTSSDKVFLARTSFHIDLNETVGKVKNNDMFFSRPLNALEYWPNGEVVISRTATGPGYFIVQYRIEGEEIWTTANLLRTQSAGQNRDEHYEIPVSNQSIELFVQYKGGEGDSETISHMVLFTAAQNNDTGRVDKPENLTPADQSTSITATPTLVGSAYRSIYNLDQGGAQFQIAEDSKFSVLVLNTSTDVLTSWELVAGQVANWTDSVAYGNKKVMAVGDGGAVSVTTDGGHAWTARTFGAATNIKSIAWNQDQVFLVGGASGLLAYSSNEGTTWTTATPAASYSGTFNAVAAQGNLMLAVGTSGEIQTSQNFGVIWTHRNPANSYNGSFNAVTMDVNGRCIAVGSSGEIQTSNDFGLNWTRRTPAGGYNQAWQDVDMDEFGFAIAVGANGEIQVSTDYGSTWTKKAPANAYTSQWNSVSVRRKDGKVEAIVVGADGMIQTSHNNGNTWFQRPTGGGESGVFTSVTLDEELYSVILGVSGKVQVARRLEGEVGTSYTVPTGDDLLKTNKVYWWRCRYQDNAGFWSAYSDPTAFATSTSFDYIAQPQNLSPANAATGIPLTPTLQGSPFAFVGAPDTHTKSQWQVSAAQDFSSVLYDSGESNDLNAHNVPSGNGMVTLQTYYWRVRYKGTTNFSAWSVPTQFRVQDVPARPTILAPLNNAVGVPPNPTIQTSSFSSTAAGESHGKTQYQIATDSAFTNLVYDSGESNNLTSITVPTVNRLAPGVDYYLRVRHKGITTGFSPWSNVHKFNTAVPATPLITSPTENQTEVALIPTFTTSTFTSITPGETHHRTQYQLSTSPTFGTITYDSGDVTGLISFTIPSASFLASNTQYYLRVRHRGTLSGYSEWSPTRTFKTAIAVAPIITAPANSATSVSVTPNITSSAFVPVSSGDAHSRSQWQIASTVGFSAGTIIVDSGESTNLTALLVAPALAHATTYFVRVRHKGTLSSWGPWSSTTTFTTAIPMGSQDFTQTGSFDLTIPAGVTSISALAIGPGANGTSSYGGGGGAKGYKNNIAVTPGETLTVVTTPANSAQPVVLRRGSTVLLSVAGANGKNGGAAPANIDGGNSGGNGGDANGSYGGGGGAAGRNSVAGGNGSSYTTSTSSVWVPGNTSKSWQFDRSTSGGVGYTNTGSLPASLTWGSTSTNQAVGATYWVQTFSNLVYDPTKSAIDGAPTWRYSVSATYYVLVETGTPGYWDNRTTYSSTNPTGTAGSGRGGAAGSDGEGANLSGDDLLGNYGGGGGRNRNGQSGAMRIIWGSNANFSS